MVLSLHQCHCSFEKNRQDSFSSLKTGVSPGSGAGAGAGASIRGRAIGAFLGCFSIYPIILLAFVPSLLSPAKFVINTLRWQQQGIENEVSLTVWIHIEFRILWEENKRGSDDCEHGPKEEYQHKGSFHHLLEKFMFLDGVFQSFNTSRTERERHTAGLGTHHYICWPFLRNMMIIIKFKTIFLYKIKNKIKKIRCICKVKNTPTKLMILVVQLLEGGCIVWVYDLGIHLASHAQVGIRTSCFAMIYFYMSIIYTWSIIWF